MVLCLSETEMRVKIIFAPRLRRVESLELTLKSQSNAIDLVLTNTFSSDNSTLLLPSFLIESNLGSRKNSNPPFSLDDISRTELVSDRQ